MLRGAIPSRVYQILRRPLGRVLRVVPFLATRYGTKQAPTRIELDGTYEPDVSAILRSVVQPGWICVDVGAHIGQIALFLAHLVGPEGHVVAFEAHPENAQQLARNVACHGFQDRIRIEAKAISDGSDDTVLLYPGRSSREAEWNIVGHDVEGQRTQPAFEVPATSLDSYFSACDRIDLVKIDIEGAEALALAGMKRILRELRPFVLVEFHDSEGWRGRMELHDAGYHLYTTDGRVLDPVTNLERVYHCVACPVEREVDWFKDA